MEKSQLKLKTNRKRELLITEKQSLCLYKQKNPLATYIEIAHYFHSKWGFKISLSTIKEVLGRKQQWLSLPSEGFVEKQKRVRRSKLTEIENALYVSLCDIAASKAIPITKELILSTAKEIIEDFEPHDFHFNYSNGWFTGFKHRFGLEKIGPNVLKKGYSFQGIHENEENVIKDICETELDSLYLLMTVPLYHCYKPNGCSQITLNQKLMVFLCINASGTDMMSPLVLGQNEAKEDNPKLHYVQATEPSWGYVHWLQAAEAHVKNRALVLTGPESFTPYLPFKHLKLQVRKMSCRAFPVLKNVADKIVFLFKTSYRLLQLRDKSFSEGSYLSKCLGWIKDAWWGLPSGALHGYWHQIPCLMLVDHKCALPHNAEKLCLAIEEVALRHLSTALKNTELSPLDLVNIENSLCQQEKLSLNDIMTTLLLHDKIFKTISMITSSSGDIVLSKPIVTATPTSESSPQEKPHTPPDEPVTDILTSECGKDVEEVSKPVTMQDALEAIDKVIRFLSNCPTERKLYRDALKIWNFLDSHK